MSSSAEARAGTLSAFLAYFLWGLFPVYFKAVAEAPSAEIMAHRVIWSIPVAVLLIFLLRQPVQLLEIWRNKKLLGMLAVSATAIGSNWFLFTWAVTQGRILETSLGYFINPIFTILLGVLVLREKLSHWKKAALLLAALGVGWQIVVRGELPWVSLCLAFTFGIYGFVRKQTPVNSLNGLLVETLFMLPVALGYFLPLFSSGASLFGHVRWQLDALLVLAGLVTTIPLVLFASGARRISLTTLGFLQYTSPTCTLLLAVFVYHEHFSPDRIVSFACIWAGLVLIGVEAVRAARKA